MAAALNTMVQILFPPRTSQALVPGWVPGATDAAEHDVGGWEVLSFLLPSVLSIIKLPG